jgi:uncharacterized membrane protein
MSAHEDEAPPPGEEIHLPGPSLVPFLNAVGLAMAIVGITTFWIVSAVGLLLFFFTLIRWIRDVRRDFDELPLEHGHH